MKFGNVTHVSFISLETFFVILFACRLLLVPRSLGGLGIQGIRAAVEAVTYSIEKHGG